MTTFGSIIGEAVGNDNFYRITSTGPMTITSENGDVYINDLCRVANNGDIYTPTLRGTTSVLSPYVDASIIQLDDYLQVFSPDGLTSCELQMHNTTGVDANTLGFEIQPNGRNISMQSNTQVYGDLSLGPVGSAQATLSGDSSGNLSLGSTGSGNISLNSSCTVNSNGSLSTPLLQIPGYSQYTNTTDSSTCELQMHPVSDGYYGFTIQSNGRNITMRSNTIIDGALQVNNPDTSGTSSTSVSQAQGISEFSFDNIDVVANVNDATQDVDSLGLSFANQGVARIQLFDETVDGNTTIQHNNILNIAMLLVVALKNANTQIADLQDRVAILEAA
jgi:hypothetical protein